MKIFGREPAMILMAVYALVAVCAQFVYPMSIAQQGYLNAAMAAGMGLVISYSVAREKFVPAIVGLAKAILALALAFGMHMSVGGQAAIMSAVVTISALLIRGQVVAAVTPTGEDVQPAPVLPPG